MTRAVPHRTSPSASHTQPSTTSAKPPRTAGRRAVIWGAGGALNSPGMAYWMIVCAVYLYTVIFGVNIRICRIPIEPKISSSRWLRRTYGLTRLDEQLANGHALTHEQ